MKRLSALRGRVRDPLSRRRSVDDDVSAGAARTPNTGMRKEKIIVR